MQYDQTLLKLKRAASGCDVPERASNSIKSIGSISASAAGIKADVTVNQEIDTQQESNQK